MATLNRKIKAPRTHEGAVASHLTPEQTLKRSVMACLLWEKQFYEDGMSIANRIANLVKLVPPVKVMSIAIEAREQMKLRHVPLLLMREVMRTPVKDSAIALERIIQRPDELTEFLSIYWKDGRCPLSGQVKKGLAKAFTKFDAYSLAKYNRDKAVKLRDVLFLCHAKPKDKEQEKTWKKIVDGTLEPPDTWEVNLSAGKDKKQTWERMLAENRLGGMALLRNLRNMEQVSVQRSLVSQAIRDMKTTRILPFRFLAAAKAAPSFEPELESALFKCAESIEKLQGLTIVVVDCSGSMTCLLSERSIMSRFDAAASIAMICREICQDVRVFAYGTKTLEVAPRRGFALRDALYTANVGHGTYLGECTRTVHSKIPEYDRIFVFTDEQTADNPENPKGTGYVINVASYQNGIGYGAWNHIDGFSEAFLGYVRERESSLK